MSTRERREEREGKESSVSSLSSLYSENKKHINIKNGDEYGLIVCGECADGGGFV